MLGISNKSPAILPNFNPPKVAFTCVLKTAQQREHTRMLMMQLPQDLEGRRIFFAGIT